MSKELFVVDSNIFITPYKKYYPFDLAPRYWEQLKCHIQDGSILLLDVVNNELLAGKDPLSDWITDMNPACVIVHNDQNILNKYRDVLQYIQTATYYKLSALNEWAREDVADAWLIATAAVKGYTLITLEVSKNDLQVQRPSKEAKIPDVANHFNVKTENLNYMLRALNIHL
jgi:hypothetical protein